VYFLCRLILFSSKFSDAGTNSKVGGQGSGEKVGAPIQFFLSCPSTFLAMKVQLVVLMSAFVMVVRFGRFLLAVLQLTVPPVHSHL